MDVSPSGLGELLGPAQKGNREIKADDGGAKFRKRKRVATMTATDINELCSGDSLVIGIGLICREVMFGRLQDTLLGRQ